MYRIYFVGPDGHFKRAAYLSSANDADALAEAAIMVDERLGIEIWEGVRLVGTLERSKSP